MIKTRYSYNCTITIDEDLISKLNKEATKVFIGNGFNTSGTKEMIIRELNRIIKNTNENGLEFTDISVPAPSLIVI